MVLASATLLSAQTAPYAPKQSDRPEVLTGDEAGFQSIFDGDANRSLVSYRLFGLLSGSRLQGDTIYFDERNRSSVGTFDLGRTGDIYN